MDTISFTSTQWPQVSSYNAFTGIIASRSVGGSVMELAGCLKVDGPVISTEEAIEAARRHVVDQFNQGG